MADEVLERRKKRFGENLKRIMALRDIDASQLSRETGIARPTIYTYMRGSNIPNLVIMSLLADVLDTSIDALYGHTKKKSNEGTHYSVDMNKLDRRTLEGLLEAISELNPDGQRDVLEYARVLVSSRKYARKKYARYCRSGTGQKQCSLSA